MTGSWLLRYQLIKFVRRAAAHQPIGRICDEMIIPAINKPAGVAANRRCTPLNRLIRIKYRSAMRFAGTAESDAARRAGHRPIKSRRAHDLFMI